MMLIGNIITGILLILATVLFFAAFCGKKKNRKKRLWFTLLTLIVDTGIAALFVYLAQG